MYTTFLVIHSWLRWIFLILALVVMVKSIMGMSGNKDYLKGDNAMASAFVGLLDLQFLIGIVLYFWLSDITSNAWSGEVSPMKNAGVRFWAVEHLSMMLIGITLAHIGKIKVKKLSDSAKKFKTQAIFFGIALVLILSRIPWGESARLFRF